MIPMLHFSAGLTTGTVSLPDSGDKFHIPCCEAGAARRIHVHNDRGELLWVDRFREPMLVKPGDILVAWRPQIKILPNWSPTEEWLDTNNFKQGLSDWWINGEPNSVIRVDLRWSRLKGWTLQDPDTCLPVYPKSADDILNVMKAIGVK